MSFCLICVPAFLHSFNSGGDPLFVYNYLFLQRWRPAILFFCLLFTGALWSGCCGPCIILSSSKGVYAVGGDNVSSKAREGMAVANRPSQTWQLVRTSLIFDSELINLI